MPNNIILLLPDRMTEQVNPTPPAFDTLRLSLPVGVETGFAVDPRDLSIVVPKGNGVYGFQQPEKMPFHEAPPQDPAGGIIHFDSDIDRPDLEALTRILEIQNRHTIKPTKQFAVFIAESQNPREDGYLKQMRLVDSFGLRFLFQAIKDRDYDSFPEQPMTMTDALWGFIEDEKKDGKVIFGISAIPNSTGNLVEMEIMQKKNYHSD